MRKSIALVSGHRQGTDRDAVGEYTRLLQAQLPNSELIPINGGPIAWITKLRRAVMHHDVIHFQYPSEGWGKSILPGIMPFICKLLYPDMRKTKMILTAHEWKSMHVLRKISLIPLLNIISDLIFVAKDQEASFFSSRMRYIFRGTTHVIPIGSNINTQNLHISDIDLIKSEFSAHDILISYFGFLYESKQPMKMVKSIEILSKAYNKTPKFIILGDYQPDHAKEKKALIEYIEKNMSESTKLFGYIENEAQINAFIKASDCVLMLFEDGVSARRSSFWHVINLGVPVITTKPNSSEDQDFIYKLKRFETEGRVILVDRYDDPEKIASTIANSKLQKFEVSEISANWQMIADIHKKVYEK